MYNYEFPWFQFKTQNQNTIKSSTYRLNKDWYKVSELISGVLQTQFLINKFLTKYRAPTVLAALRNIFLLNIAPSHSTECHMQSSAARILPDCPTSKDVVIEFALWVCNCHWLCIFCFLTFTQGIRFVFSGL